MLVIDGEFSGLDFYKHSILSLGAIELEHPERQFYEECRAWDGAKIEDEALAVNGFTHEQATDPNKQTEADLIHHFIEFGGQANDQTFAGQNVGTDRDFLRLAA